MHLLHLSGTTRLIIALPLFTLAMLALAFFSRPVFAAGGPGDGSTSSSWMEDKRMLVALSAIREKNYSGAVKILSALVADRPDFANGWNYLGFSLRKSGALKRSEKAYLKALQLDPEHRGAHEYLAELYLQTNRRKMAEDLERNLTVICKFGCMELDELRAALKGEGMGDEW